MGSVTVRGPGLGDDFFRRQGELWKKKKGETIHLRLEHLCHLSLPLKNATKLAATVIVLNAEVREPIKNVLAEFVR